MLKNEFSAGQTAPFDKARSTALNATVVLGLTLAGLAGPAAAQDNRIDTIRPDAPALAKYGSLGIGVKTLTLVNPKQLDIVKSKAGEPMPTYDRPLTVEVWYPGKAADATSTPSTPGRPSSRPTPVGSAISSRLATRT